MAWLLNTINLPSMINCVPHHTTQIIRPLSHTHTPTHTHTHAQSLSVCVAVIFLASCRTYLNSLPSTDPDTHSEARGCCNSLMCSMWQKTNIQLQHIRTQGDAVACMFYATLLVVQYIPSARCCSVFLFLLSVTGADVFKLCRWFICK